LGIKKSLKGWLGGRRQREEAPAAATGVAATEAAAPAALEPEIVAVIAAVLAVEVKMFMSLQGQRFTFSAGGPAQGWSDWGRQLVRPYQGVR
jgi:hypothetical protein